jgi:hypothetical protein
MGGKGWPARKADLTAICELIVERKCGNLNDSLSYGPSWPVTGIALPFLLPLLQNNLDILNIYY